MDLTARWHVPRGNRRHLRRVFGHSVTTPDHVQVRANENEIVAIDIAGDAIRHVEELDRRAARTNGAFEPAGVGFTAAELEDRITIGNAVLQRRAVVEPDMRQPRARPRGRLIVAEQMLGTARYVAVFGELT